MMKNKTLRLIIASIFLCIYRINIAQGQNISFPVGMVSNDEQAICFTWGVKSLPWLILTNKQHIVIAEGFNLDELEVKIKTITEK
jgi:hypothetical protein